MNGSPLQARGGQAAFGVRAELGCGLLGTGTVENLAFSRHQGQEQRPTGVSAVCCQFCISRQGERVRLGFASQMFGTPSGYSPEAPGSQLSLAPTQSLLDLVQAQAES